MLRKTTVLITVFILLFAGNALALDGEVIFRDSLYGAAVGGLIGIGVYAMDGRDAGPRIGGGVVFGTACGAIVGVMESTGMFAFRDGKLSIGVPTPYLAMNGHETQIRAGLLDVDF